MPKTKRKIRRQVGKPPEKSGEEYWVRERGGRIFAKTPYLNTFPPLATAMGGTWSSEYSVWWWPFDVITVDRVRELCLRCYGTDFNGTLGKKIPVTVYIPVKQEDAFTKIVFPNGVEAIREKAGDEWPSEPGEGVDRIHHWYYVNTDFLSYLAWKPASPLGEASRVLPTWFHRNDAKRQSWGDPDPLVAVLAEQVLNLSADKRRDLLCILQGELK